MNKGQKGHISIGFAGRDVKLSRLPGWENNSWGYHGDDGCSFAADKSGTGTPYGPTFGTGDIVGCGIDFTTHRAFFTKNGTFIGPVFDGIGRDIEIFPSIGLRHSSEHVRVNFGHEPFKYDIDYHVQQQQTSVWTKVLTTPVNSSLLNACVPQRDNLVDSAEKAPLTDGQARRMINKIVLSYLEHHGYGKTLRTFQEQLGSSSTTSYPARTSDDHDVVMYSPIKESAKDEDEMVRRTKVVHSVVSGDIDTAVSEIQTHYPTVLEAEEGLMLFKLRCRKFVELLLEAAELKKRMKRRSFSKSGREVGLAGSNGLDDGSNMEVDGDDFVLASSSPALLTITNGSMDKSTSSISGTSRRRSSLSPANLESGDSMYRTTAQYEVTLNQAIAYGKSLANGYKDDARPEVKQIFSRTFALVAWEDPLSAGGMVTEVARHEARIPLAHELNQAILKSQGQPTNPVLETLYRHTTVCITELGLRGQGEAAFADIHREFLEG